MDFHDFDDDDQDSNGEKFMYGGKDGTIFLIDVTMPMFCKNENSDNAFKTCVESCKTVLLNRIIGGHHDLFAMIFFGTSKTENDLKASHVVTFQELSESSADKIKQLEKLVDSDDCDDFNTKYGHSNDFLLSDAFWLCQTIFSKSPYKLSSCRIVLFTNTSDPHPGDAVKQHQARVRASDLSQADINLDLIHIGNAFDASLFYKELLQVAEGESGDDYELPNPCTSFQDMYIRVNQVAHKRRALCKVFFNLGNEVTFAVNLYNLVQEAKMPKKIFLDQTCNEAVKSVTQYFDGETAEAVLPADIKECQSFGEKRILFRSEEIRQLHHMSEPEMKLLGFKPASRIKFHHYIKPSSFIYPEDSWISGCCTLFTALLERCVAKSVVPICYLTPRQNATPQLVALLPQLEQLNEKNDQKVPPGFHVIYLPYADNIRKVEINTCKKASPEQVATSTEMVKKIKFKYDPYAFENPTLQTLWSNIEALALDHSQPREVVDYTLPNYEIMKKKYGNISQEFLSMVASQGYNTNDKKKPAPTKRPSKPEVTPVAKVPKTELVSDEDMNSLVQEGKVHKLTINQLKNYMASKHLPGLSGVKKDGLVAMVEHYVRNGSSS